MFFESEFTGSLTFLLLVLALFIGTSPVGLAFAIKLVLYRRRLAEDVALAPRARHKTLLIDGTLEDFAIALAHEIDKFRRPRRSLVVNERSSRIALQTSALIPSRAGESSLWILQTTASIRSDGTSMSWSKASASAAADSASS